MLNRPESGPDSPFQLMPPLTADERAQLKDDIRQKGVLVPIVFDEFGNILDGHHRAELYYELVDEGHKIPPYNRQVVRGLSDEAKIGYVVGLNMARRHLTREQRAEVYTSLRAMGMTLQKISDSSGGQDSVATVSRMLAEVGAEIPAFAVGADGKQYPTTYTKVILVSGDRHERELKALERAAARSIVPDNMPTLDGRYKIIHGDFRELGDDVIAPDSIDVIITDPPYPKEYNPLYSDLGRYAARVLKPGGSLVAMVGQIWLPEVIGRLREAGELGLIYRWTMSISMSKEHSSVMDRRVHVGWKPILVYTKGKMPEDARWVYDVVTSDSADKEYHHWGQGLSGFLQLVERFTNPGQLVLDPFNGGGTTGIAALQLNRMYIGIDNDQTAIATTLNRIAETFAGKDTGEDVPSA